MLLCRRLLLQVHLPNRAPTQFFTRRFLFNGLANSLQPGDARADLSRPLSEEIAERQHTVPPHEDIMGQLLERVARVSMHSAANKSKKVRQAEKEKGVQHDTFDAYIALRNRDRSLLAALSPTVLVGLAETAVQYGSSAVMDCLATDVLEAFIADKDMQSKIALILLSITSRGPHPLHKSHIYPLLNLLVESHLLSSLTPNTVTRMMKSIADSPSPDVEDEKILDILLPVFQAFLQNISLPRGSQSISYRPPEDIFVAFGLVDKLLLCGRDEQALDLFRVLVETNHIPAEALHEMNPPTSTSQGFASIIRFTLVRSCLHWSWHNRALDIVTSLTRGQPSLSEETLVLSTDALYAVLEEPTPLQLKHCCWLMCHLDQAIDEFSIPDRMIRLLYDRAYQMKRGGPAEALFKHTQSSKVLERVHYPLPRGAPLTWMLEYLTTKSRSMHLARMLATQVVELSEPIPLQDRGRFIALTATHGFAIQARALWERYSVGRDRNFVVGNAKTMVRVVSLFSSLVSRTSAKVAILAPHKNNGLEGVQHLDHEREVERMSDLSDFANRVVDDFRKLNEPLTEAHHFQLTTLARGYFMLGRVVDGFNMFSIILQRREIPDMHDINVALSAMAEYSPRNAAEKVERMIERGLPADAVTFGTILHHAVVHGDMDLVSSLLSRARDLDRGELTEKSLAAVIRATVRIEGETRSTLKTNLQRAWNIIRSSKKPNVICTPNMGKYCIFAALHIEEPALAFKFWDFLVKGKAEWKDREQVFQRRLIADLIRKHCQEGSLDRDDGLMMLRRLKEGGDTEMPTAT
ncbi:hypothetical protein BV22DRAFT_1198875 [Leucogyrophana mollusca]|uniref:Uncharacterized protein n=1 Tax=Leucogyrophana mollusca TaxID=85980 RepID=A0ACB8B6I0_9AGAM|nr:hypothetical protein BV22DRAFT_1198875 [Leucogyrophana mollusca]